MKETSHQFRRILSGRALFTSPIFRLQNIVEDIYCASSTENSKANVNTAKWCSELYYSQNRNNFLRPETNTVKIAISILLDTLKECRITHTKVIYEDIFIFKSQETVGNFVK